MKTLPSRRILIKHPRAAFTLPQLLVVLGIIALLIAILIPAIISARRQAVRVNCQANLRELGAALRIYSNENRGWLFPVSIGRYDQAYATFGTGVPPHERWPMKVFRVSSAPATPPYDPDDYLSEIYDPQKFPAAPYTPAVLRCPADEAPVEAHSYVLNAHLAERAIRAGASPSVMGGLSSAEVILAGEKISAERDYYMQNRDFARVVEQRRHGGSLGGNYLYLDGHVGMALAREGIIGIDPWDVKPVDRRQRR